ncbi:unnamed protein product [Dovyalis caffra]|uniref:Ubiquinol oxidase n=1 Tax=Dovyalis caffra TaxID=77055 RepID=A0AAV1SL58_9ROSI|nr:unnamed protein product [Dovyalis caffra]
MAAAILSSSSSSLCRVQATVLKENEEKKVVVEESFKPKTSTHEPEASPQPSAPTELETWVIKLEQSVNVFLTDSVIKILDTLYHDRDYARFYVLETIARVPYFAFMSVLHMYESFGWWRRADYLKVHFAESWNEMHHLLIMEELGGNSWWFDRFLAQHIAIFYYIMTVLMYALSPRMAYHFSECVESHAFETYDKFIKARGEDLKKMPASEVAVKYYTGGDLYLFDEFQTSRAPNSRRPKIENLYDVFLNIRDDEAEHCKTMKACQTHGNLRSPHSYPEDALEDDTGCELPQADCEGVVDCLKKSAAYLTTVSKEKNQVELLRCDDFKIVEEIERHKYGRRELTGGTSPHREFRGNNLQNATTNGGTGLSVKELDGLLILLAEKKRKMEQEEAETNMRVLLDFLYCLRKQKLDELNEIETDLQYIKEDINAVERQRIELCRAKDRCSLKLSMFADDLNSQFVTQSGPNASKKKWVHEQFNCLQECYLQKRRNWVRKAFKEEERDTDIMNREGYNPGLEDFQSVLTNFTRYSRLRVVAELRHGDLFHSANIVSSIEFDRDDELFATAGVSRRIKIFEFSSVMNEPEDVYCPLVEMSTRSKLSCLSWNKYAKNHIASSDYEGIVTVWDVATRQSIMEYEEHEKRAWSVDFSQTEPSMLVSGSDDCKVKIWCTKQEASVLNIDMKANICSVKYNPGSSFHVAVGSADHHVHYYDLRNISQPLYVFNGHRKAVSYVKFLSSHELASASTDSTLRLWDVKENLALRTFRGHTNEKNFVGLTVTSEYIACGSETNEVLVYHKAISKPAAWHRFSTDLENGEDDAGSYFISAVCWKSDSLTMLTANSQGTIKVLVLAA